MGVIRYAIGPVDIAAVEERAIEIAVELGAYDHPSVIACATHADREFVLDSLAKADFISEGEEMGVVMWHDGTTPGDDEDGGYSDDAEAELAGWLAAEIAYTHGGQRS